MTIPGRNRAAAARLPLLMLVVLSTPATFAGGGLDLCETCHAVATRSLAQHPVDVRITGRVAGDGSGLPLDGDVMTCLTCHTGHGPEARNALDGEFYLRATVPQLCAKCHLGPDGTWDVAHARYADSIHGGPRLARLSGVENRSRPNDLDAPTARCLSCHGTADAEPGLAGRPQQIDLPISHPMGRYPVASWSAGTRLSRQRDLRPELRLAGERMTCATCHRLYQVGLYKLALGSRVRLCLGCHDFDQHIERAKLTGTWKGRDPIPERRDDDDIERAVRR